MKIVELMPHQRVGVRQIYDFGGRALLADEMGLGKTVQSLWWIWKLAKRRPAVIVTPSSVKYQWQAEAMDHFGMRAQVLDGRYRNGRAYLDPVVILNYDILESWLPVLLAHKPRIVVLDECHYLKSLTAQRTKAARKLASGADSVLALSGTPLTNRPIELWSVLSVLRPDLFPDRMRYAWRYCAPKRTIWGWKFDGATNLPELHSILRQNVMIRRLKKEVLKDLPDKIHKSVPFKLSDTREYDSAKNDFIRWLSKTSPGKVTKARKAQALVKIGYLIRLCAKLRMAQTIKWIEEFSEAHPDKKLVGLTMHTFVVDQLREHFPGSVFVDGRVTGRQRIETVRQFQSNDRIRYFWGNWKAAGIGLNLTASHTLVSLDLPWTAGDLLQGQDRIHRIGQKMKVIIYYLLSMGTIEEDLMRSLRRKIEILGSVLDGRATSRDFDVFSDLIRSLRK